jgi:NADPH2:quinone reductase
MTMKAAYLQETGGHDVFQYGDLPDPVAGPGELLVRVRAAAVNHVDTVWRSGIRPYFKITPPHVLGYEAAGEIVALGAGVTGFSVGDNVVARTKTGAYAELATMDAASTVRVPANMSLEEAASLATTGPTAFRMVVRRAAVRAGETVLITAAASGTGSLMVQIAKAAGARVIATAGGQRKRDIVLGLGADAVIDHYEEDVAKRLLELTGGQGADAAIDAVASQPLFDAILTGLRPGGRVVIYGNMVAPQLNFTARIVFSKGLSIIGGQGSDPRTAASEAEIDRAALMVLAEAGSLKVLVDRVLPLAQVGEAHRAMDAHEPAGKIILAP